MPTGLVSPVGVGCPCPWLEGQEKLKRVLRVVGVAIIDFLGIGWAVSTAACMFVCVARDASPLLRVGALTGVVVSCAVATFVSCGVALVGVMIPALAFQASRWLFLDFLYMDFFVADIKAVCYNSVGRRWVSERDEYMCGFLLNRSPWNGLDPAD